MAGLRPQAPLIDTDGDGIPDCWEQARGLDSNDGDDHNRVMDSGYTAVEEYCNILARRLVETKGLLPARGDVNGDGKVGLSDLSPLLKAVLLDSHTWNADLDLDLEMNISDLGIWWDIFTSGD